MLIAAHALEVLLLLAVPYLLARRLAGRWELPRGVFGVGLLTFIFAEIGRMLFARATSFAFTEQWIPLPSEDALPVVSAALAGFAAALTGEGVRVYAYRRYLPDHRTSRAGVLHGLGHGGAQAMLSGALVLFMAGLAILGKGKNFEEMQAMGFEGRTAIRVGMKVYAWWEGSPLSAVLAGLNGLWLVALHVGLSVAVARAMRGAKLWLLAAALLHGLAVFALTWAADALPGEGAEAGLHAGIGVAGLLLAWAAARQGPGSEAPSSSASEAGDDEDGAEAEEAGDAPSSSR
ncbi:MAG TPA: YhfC family glutamic-type intramembrane protease [Polyangiaceae bacterium LLY-WYZ-15_(1-7)]|nr:hypothetical protein [Myxococcales bacterium]MAT27969.1 hypothetical protein [Sandaracinus sp.]HJL06115.1 YhfC family glutamic-type intramembrane protease [Polyangiaceae bacterium LLY-WYZ-15_(1-7)]MBJ71243.1 hypothetical protein [Sandaracinus sp.]HJL06959.1 YhfC family glutamic-type intramembrane protease [Polyangiaceae bacterium LLY-WYZ-15_(1-7)]